MSKNRIDRIEATTLTSVSLEGSYRMLSEYDFQYLLNQAREYENGTVREELVKQILGND